MNQNHPAMFINRLITIKNNIEKMDQINQIEILKIFSENNIFINESGTGSLINLTEVPLNILSKLEEYIAYSSQREKILTIAEQEQKKYQDLLGGNS